MKQKNKSLDFRRQFLSIILVPVIIIVSIFLILIVASFQTVEGFVMNNSGLLGNATSDISTNALERQLSNNIKQIAADTAFSIDDKLRRLQNFSKMLSEYCGGIYANPKDYKARELEYIPGGKRQTGPVNAFVHSRNGVAFNKVKDEAALISNVSDIINQIPNISRDIFSCMIAGDSGYIIAYDPTQSPSVNYNPEDRDWYIGAKEQGGLYWTDFYIDIRGGGILIACSIPFYQTINGKKTFKGAVACTASLGSFSNFINTVGVINRKESYVFLLDKQGTKLFSSDGSGIKIDENNNLTGENYLESGNSELKHLAELMVIGASGIMAVNINGEECEVAYHPLSILDWSAGVVYKKSVIEESVIPLENHIQELTTNMKNHTRELFLIVILTAIVISLAAIGLIMLFVIKNAKTISQPIVNIAKEVKHIADGHMDYHVNESTGIKEIDTLSVTFNDMTNKLKEHIEDLRSVTAEKQRISTELNVATRIQTEMLPFIFPPFPDKKNTFDLYAKMYPAKEVGGDLYDFFFIDDDYFAVIVADVSGKGVPAALFMVITKTLLKTALMNSKDPKEAIENVNNQLCQNNVEGIFVTIWIGVLEISTGIVRYINAGHNPPLVKIGDNPFSYLNDNRHDLVAGFMADTDYHLNTLTLHKDDVLFLYTDGITEAFNEEDKMFGEENLKEYMDNNNNRDLHSLLENLKNTIDNFSVGKDQSDDITMLAIRIGIN